MLEKETLKKIIDKIYRKHPTASLIDFIDYLEKEIDQKEW
jgi:hypothetical protein